MSSGWHIEIRGLGHNPNPFCFLCLDYERCRLLWGDNRLGFVSVDVSAWELYPSPKIQLFTKQLQRVLNYETVVPGYTKGRSVFVLSNASPLL